MEMSIKSVNNDSRVLEYTNGSEIIVVHAKWGGVGEV